MARAAQAILVTLMANPELRTSESLMEVSLPQDYKEDGILEEYPGTQAHHENAELFGLGVEEGVSPTGTPLLLHDRERSICDLIADRKAGVADAQLLGQPMRSYFSDGGKDLPRLARYARAMGLSAELQTYLEVLA